MPSKIAAATKAPFLSGSEPQLYVADVRASCEFFAAKLGFTTGFVYGDPPFYAQVERDNARLNLRLVCEPVFSGDIREREALLSASITVATSAEIERLFAEFESKGVRFAQTLTDEPWGAKTFVVADPDGNLIVFAGSM
jgi:catechol 2,3-dioxygenase-like lactoylglutathione lyase family enzyme